MSAKKTRILVVDDDVRMLRVMRRVVELEGYDVQKSADGQSALNFLDENTPDLILLDIMMPGMDGLTVCKRIREFSPVPIIMVTAMDDDEEKVLGLDAGADDYIAKPFSSKELAARVRATLRRAKRWEERKRETFSRDGLEIVYTSHKATLNSQELDLTATEYRLLSYLAINAGRVLTPDQILEKVWGDDYVGEHEMLRVNITRLRQKLGEDSKNPMFILTKHDMGYTIEKESSSK